MEPVTSPQPLTAIDLASGNGPPAWNLSRLHHVEQQQQHDVQSDTSSEHRSTSSNSNNSSTHVTVVEPGTFVNPITLRETYTVNDPAAGEKSAVYFGVSRGGLAASSFAMPDDGSGKKSVWRVEKFQLQAVDEESFGIFFSGDSYVVVYESAKKGPYVYYWLGNHSTVDERGTAALKTIELDDQLFGGMATHVRIVQGKEPPHFLAMFDGFIVVLEGGYPSGFQPTHARADVGKSSSLPEDGTMPTAPKPGTFNANDNHLFHVRAAYGSGGNKLACNHNNNLVAGIAKSTDTNTSSMMKLARATEVEFRARSLNSNDVFVATTKARVACVWYGRGSARVEREMAQEVCKRLAAGGAHARAQWSANDPVCEGEEEPWFWDAIGGREDYADHEHLQQMPEPDDGGAAPHEARLFHCSNASGEFKVEEVPSDFDQSNLVADDVMLLDTSDSLWMWIGARANRAERYHTEQFAQEYMKLNCCVEVEGDGVCIKMPIYVVKQGAEPINFCGFFGVWDDRISKREMEASWSARKQQQQGAAAATADAAGVTDSTHLHPNFSSSNISPRTSPTSLSGPLPTREQVADHFVPYESLCNKLAQDLPFGVDPRCKELYLSDAEFERVFKMSYDKYQQLPAWKQKSTKKAVGLF